MSDRKRIVSHAKCSRSSALEDLRRLKEQGKSGLDAYKVTLTLPYLYHLTRCHVQVDFGDIYDEVDEDSYIKHVKKKVQEEDDFVVDDDGQGYAETGLEIWDQPRDEYSDADDYEGEYDDEYDQGKYNVE